MEFPLYLSGVTIVFLLFQLIFPFKIPQKVDLSLIEINKKKYNRLEGFTILWIFLSVGLISILIYIFGTRLTELSFPSEYEYIVTPTGSYWFFPGLILGFGLIRVPMEFIYKLILKGEYRTYTLYTNMKHGFNGEKIWRPIEFILTISGIIVFVLGLNWFVRFDQNQKTIEINELFKVETVSYKINEITEIYHFNKYVTKKGKTKRIDNYSIKMKDSYEWNSYIYGFFSIQKDKELINKRIMNLCKLTGLKINEKSTTAQQKI